MAKHPPKRRIQLDDTWAIRTVNLPLREDGGAWWCILKDGQRVPGIQRGPKGSVYPVARYKDPIDAMRAVGELKELGSVERARMLRAAEQTLRSEAEIMRRLKAFNLKEG